MFLVKTCVKPSPIAGWGLFADEDIMEGQVVWEYTPDTTVIISKDHLDTLELSCDGSQQVEFYLTYGYYVSKFDSLVICLDNGRFVNHSDEPNIGTTPMCSDDQHWQQSIALCDIKKVEELVENYHTYNAAAWHDDMSRRYGLFVPEPLAAR